MIRHLPLVLILALTVAMAGCGRHSDGDDEGAAGAAVDVVATVKVQPLQRGGIEQKITAYGSVVAEPGKSVGLSVPYECAVVRTLVVPGQLVNAGDPIVEVAASTATRLQVGQAESALKAAETELKQTRQRYDLKLATNQDLNLAQRAADDARLQLNSLQRSGAPTHSPVTSPVDGVVISLSAQSGQIVAPGITFAEIVARDAIEVRLNVEPDDLNALDVGDGVNLIPVNQARAKAVTGTVRLLTASVNPTSRLVDVFVGLPKGSGFLLGGYVQAEFSRTAKGVWIVPVEALIADGDGSHIFVVRDGKASAQKIEIGLRNKERAEIRGEGLRDAESVIVEGNYELADGMRVEVK